MNYFDLKWAYNIRKAEYIPPLPDWLPKTKLVYYDDFSALRSRAMTGQAYTQLQPNASHPTVAKLVCKELGGKMCLYKAEAYNELRWDIDLGGASQYTFGAWVYCESTGGTNQQFFNFDGKTSSNVAITVILNARTSSNQIRLGGWSNNASVNYATYNSGPGAGSWNFIVGQQLASKWNIWLNGSVRAEANHAPDILSMGRILTNNAYGIGIRHAFCYSTALGSSGILSLYNATKNL